MYTPNNWVIIKINQPEQDTFYKIFAGWSGGYLTGDSWRINSGITWFEEKEEEILFHGHSGSVYQCYKDGEGFSNTTSDIYAQLRSQELRSTQIDPISYTDFVKEFINTPPKNDTEQASGL